MSHGFSADLRSRVISVISDGLSTRQAAARLGVGVSTAGEWYRRYRDNGETAARKQGQPPGSKLDTHEAFILGLVRDNSDIGLEGIAGRSLAERSVSAAPSTVWTFFKKRNITCKIKMAHASERQRSDVKAARETWSEGQPGLDPHKLVFIDETGASTRMTRLRDRAGRAQRCRAAIPHGHWKTTTFTAGLRVGAMIAPMVLDGPMNGDAFLACIRHVVVPELEKGAVVIMDNRVMTTHTPTWMRRKRQLTPLLNGLESHAGDIRRHAAPETRCGTIPGVERGVKHPAPRDTIGAWKKSPQDASQGSSSP